MSDLRRLRISGNGIDSIKNINFNAKLRVLSIFLEEISDLEGFDLSHTNLEKLFISKTKITSLNGLVLNSEIKSLGFFGNEINYIDEEFVFPQSLEGLNFDSNKLSQFDGTVLPDSLLRLSIGGNMFKDYSKVTNLPSGLRLFVVGGRNDSLDFSTLVIPDSVEELIIGVTLKATEADIMTVNFPPNLKRLDLVLNNIRSFSSIQLPSTLRHLDLRGNPLSISERKKIRERFRIENPRLKIRMGAFRIPGID
jgi:Leucine-rich repeat (LRR) protein